MPTMIRRILLLALCAVGFADARSLIQPGFRLGARVGPSELTPELGLAAFCGPFSLSMDGWVQPWRFRITEHDIPYMVADKDAVVTDVQFRERRWGFTPGVHFDYGNRVLGIVPGAGCEFSWGDWEGETEDPPFEAVGWVGAELRILHASHLGVKFYPSDARSGSWKAEYVAQFGGPKRK